MAGAILFCLLINSIPIKVNAITANKYSGLKSTVNMEKIENTITNIFSGLKYQLKIDDKYLNVKQGNGREKLSQASTLDLIGIVHSITNGTMSVEDYGKEFSNADVNSIIKSFGFDNKLDDDRNSTLGILRDMAFSKAVKDIQSDIENLGDDKPEAIRMLREAANVIHNKGGKDSELKKGARSNVYYDIYGTSFADMKNYVDGLLNTLKDNQSTNVSDNYLKEQDKPWDDSDRYDSLRRAVMFLTDENISNPITFEVVMGASSFMKQFGDSNNVYIANYDETDSAQKLLNKIIDIMIRNKTVLGDYSKNMAILSTVMQRGSKYSFGKNGTKDITHAVSLSNSAINPQALAEMIDINKQVESSINRAGASKPDAKMMYTLGLRVQFAFYAMQYEDTIPDGIATQLCKEEHSGYTLRTTNPIIPSLNQISNLEGYVMLNNVINEYSTLAEVVLPILGGIKTENELGANGKTQLRYLRSAYDGWIFLRDKSGIVPIECLKPLEEVWNKKIKINSAGDETSLAETFERLSQFIDMNNLDDYDISDNTPLRKFFNSDNKDLSPYIKYGIALSSSYIPFKTNVYESLTYKDLVGKDEFFNFHVLYGYHRKALYIDTNVSSVSENMISGKVGNLKLCTLKELLQCEKEISLYTDDNFYNAHLLEEYKDEAIAREEKAESDKDKSIASRLIEHIKTANDIDLSQALKTGTNEKYPTEMYKLKDYNSSKNELGKSPLEEIILDGNDIDKYLGNVEDLEDPTYNVMSAYAVTSGIARDSKVLDLVKNNTRMPVFKSSKNIAKMSTAEPAWRDSIINYVILKNIKNNMNVSYSSNLDMNKPVYMDIYGNILTESGYVVIPAASNVTLHSKYEPYNAGLLSTYGNEYSLPEEYSNYMDENSDSPLKKIMSFNNETECYELQGKSNSFDGEVVDLNSIILSNEEYRTALVNIYGEEMMDKLNLDLYISNVLLEVLRGAPLENIDKTAEGLVIGNLIGDNGIEQAAKLELFQENFNSKTQDAIISLPNIAFYPGLEFIIPLVVKIIIICVMIMTFKYVYILGVQRQFSLREIARYFLVLSLTLMMIYIVPKFLNFCYYWSNKALLQDEAITIAMLNTEKEEFGVEVGVQEVTEAKPKTKLYIKMEELDIPWYKVIRDISTTPILESLSEIYERYASENLAFNAKNFEFVAGDLYIDTNSLFNSTAITFNPNYRMMYDIAVDETPASFYTPYYVFLHSLVVDVNMFNIENNIFSYTGQTYKDGKLKSIGLIKPYFESDAFKTDVDGDNSYVKDLLHLKALYGKDVLDRDNIFSDQLETIQKSKWCNTDIDDAKFYSRLDKMNERAKEFVSAHQTLLGRISDETFLKMMALDLALYHNKLFNIGIADNVEIFNLASEDIARLAIAPNNDVIATSPLSFARFVYEQGGEFSIYFATILIVLFFLNSWVSPIVMIFVFVAIFSSIFVRRIIFEKNDDCIKGYFMIGLYMGGTCWAYALLLKMSTWVSELGWSPIMNMLILSCVHIAQIMMMSYIGAVVLMNWRDLGSAQFSATNVKIASVMRAIAGYGSRMTDKVGQGVLAGHEKLTQLRERRKQHEEEKKRKNIVGDKDDEDMINDRAVYRHRKDTSKKSPRTYERYKYNGGNTVQILYEDFTEEITKKEFVERYGKEPTIKEGNHLTQRLEDKWNSKE